MKFMKFLSLAACGILLLSGCARKPIDQGAAALVIYEPATGDIRQLGEDLKPYVKLYSDYAVITYTRVGEDKKSTRFTHVIPVSKLGLVRWLNPNQE